MLCRTEQGPCFASSQEVNAEPIYGNQFAYFEWDQPQGAQIVRHQFKITVWQLNYYGFYASLGRAHGVATRVNYGINTCPTNSPSHRKLEAYFAPYGWVSFDASETQKLMGIIQKEESFGAATKTQLIEAAQLR